MRWYHVVIVLLLAAVVYMAYQLYSQPAAGPDTRHPPTATSTKPTSTKATTTAPSAPLSARVQISSPAKNGSVGQEFTVAGSAPGPWYFEATFPIQVRNGDNDVIGHASANAQGDWQTDKQVAFTATVHLDEPYSGAATLILMKDNPSGLPENDDSVTLPITIHNP